MLEKESDGTYITLWVDDKIILWSNGQRTVSRLKIDAFGSKFGFYTSGVSCVTDNSAPITMNAKAFYVASARAEVAAVIDAIPALTFDNYLAEKAGSVKAAQDAVNEYLANTSANTTADIANYAKFTEALEQIAFFESNAALFGALKDIEAKIAAIPVITEANYEAELAGSIKAAEDAVAAFVATYPDYDVTTAEGYKKLAVSKEVAENNGVAENLLYYANGVSYSPWPGQERGVIDRWTYSGTASGSASAVFAFPEEFVFDATRVYRYAVDVTIEADTSDVRIPFKGNGYLDYIYFRFGPTGVQLYDPVEYTERHTLGSSDAVVAEKGKTYHVEIITGYDFATVIVDGQVVISGADLTVTTHDYTAAFCGIQTVDSAASFANMHLSYYDGEVLTPDVESDNLIDHATSVLGNEGITGYYGTFEDATNTLTIAHQGLGGEFVGIELDRTKPYVFRTKATLSEGGDAVIMLDGDDVYTGLCVTLGNGGVQVYSSAF
ncbi:MAG: hypothetical protein IJ518_03175, partial [Clostridia bacterium]|nr:hypothetical protein [Clostridia bacterium]